jgi:hypothetical protein
LALLKIFDSEVSHAFTDIAIPGIKMGHSSPQMGPRAKPVLLRTGILKGLNDNRQVIVMNSGSLCGMN